MAAEGPLETTTVRLVNDGSICIAPEYAAEELLRAEGFTDIRYVEVPSAKQIEGSGTRRGGFRSFRFRPLISRRSTPGFPVAVLAGVHVGCFELFAKEGIRSISELKGKSVGLKAAPPALLTLMAAQGRARCGQGHQLGHRPLGQAARSVRGGKSMLFLGFPPEPQELRARRIGHVIVNTARRPSMVAVFLLHVVGNRDFVREHPIATKRVLRAVLKAPDLCAAEPAECRAPHCRWRLYRAIRLGAPTLSEVPYANGATTTPRTRCASTRCGCTKSA